MAPANVVGIWEGADSTLRHEYVVFTAHYDHLGTGPPQNGDSIWNGADDNASGTAAVLAVARTVTRLPERPRRSIVFALVSGEEYLTLGSRYFLDHPPVPVSAMVANLNADMVGRNWRDTVVVTGLRDSDLGSVVDRVISSQPALKLAAIERSPLEGDGGDPYARSDHASFIRKGVPFLHFYSGVHADYHRPTDSADKLDFEKIARISQLMLQVAVEIANAEGRPKWCEESFLRLVGGRSPRALGCLPQPNTSWSSQGLVGRWLPPRH